MFNFISAGLSLMGVAQQFGAARAARRTADINAQMIREENAEKIRRLAEEQSDVEARGRATVAASGTGFGSASQTSVMQDVRRQHHAELQWLRRSGQSRVNSTLREGRLASNQARASAFSSLANVASSTAKMFGP